MTKRTTTSPRIAYDDRGNGEPVLLFLPGWASDHTQVEPTARRLAASRRALVLDWRGMGRSEAWHGDFGYDDLLQDALAVIEASGAHQIVPVAVAHAGWVAIELRRRLEDRIPQLVLTSWQVLDVSPPFRDAIAAMQDPARWQGVRDALFRMWLDGAHPDVARYVAEVMDAYGFEMVARAGREMAAAYGRFGSPLKALAALDPPVPTLHVYGQPRDEAFLSAQKAFGRAHRWFHVRRLDAESYFPTIDSPAGVVDAIEAFLGASRSIAPSTRRLEWLS